MSEQVTVNQASRPSTVVVGSNGAQVGSVTSAANGGSVAVSTGQQQSGVAVSGQGGPQLTISGAGARGEAGPAGPAGEDMPGSQAAPFSVNASEDGATYLYVGLTNEDAEWYVRRVAQDGSTLLHATLLNNPLVLTYDAAWAARATLTYGRFDQAF